MNQVNNSKLLPVSAFQARGAKKSHLVDLRPELLRDLRLLGLHELAHHAENILPPLRSGVRDVQVVEGHVLHDLSPEKQYRRRSNGSSRSFERGRDKPWRGGGAAY